MQLQMAQEDLEATGGGGCAEPARAGPARRDQVVEGKTRAREGAGSTAERAGSQNARDNPKTGKSPAQCRQEAAERGTLIMSRRDKLKSIKCLHRQAGRHSRRGLGKGADGGYAGTAQRPQHPRTVVEGERRDSVIRLVAMIGRLAVHAGVCRARRGRPEMAAQRLAGLPGMQTAASDPDAPRAVKAVTPKFASTARPRRPCVRGRELTGSRSPRFAGILW